MNTLRLPSSVLCPLYSVLCLLFLCTASRAQQPTTPQISEAVSAEFGQLRTLTEAKSYANALAVIDRLLLTVAADSYDRVLLSQIKAQILLTQGNYSAAIAPLEDVLRLAGRPGYLAEAAHTDTLFLLAQLHQQRATELSKKADLPAQLSAFDRATGYLRRWQARIQKPTTDGQLFAASLLYQRATLDPDHLDTIALEDARRAAVEGLALQIKPSASLNVLLLAVHQQRNEHTEAAEILELLVTQNHANSGYWQQLVSTYLNLAASAAPNERLAARYNLRAVLALERAQSLGLLVTPRDYFNLVALHLGLRQFGPAIALLEKGLADSTLENTRRNWEFLANAYQQSAQPGAVLATLEKATAARPADGQLAFALAQACYTAGRLPDTLRHLQTALKHADTLDKPGQALLFLAYTAYELKDFSAASTAARDAATHDDVNKDDLARLTQAIAEARAKS